MVVDILTLVHLHDDETQKQSGQSSAKVKTNSRACAIDEIKKKKNPSEAFKNKIQTRFHSSEAGFFFSRSKQTYFLSITVSAIWGKSRVTYIRRGRLEIFLRVCRRLFELSDSSCKDDEKKISKCQYGVQLEGKVFLVDSGSVLTCT